MLAVRAGDARFDGRRVALERLESLAALYLGDGDLAVAIGDDQRRAVGSEGEIGDANFLVEDLPVAPRSDLGRTFLDVPQSDGAILASGGGDLSVGAEGERVDL